jgi:uncharacterized protein YidB (DUF937 family)
MSGLLGQILGGLLGGGGQSQVLPALLNAVFSSAQGGAGGGLQGLLAQLENAGLGDHAQSWVSTGANQSVTADQLANAFTPEQVQQWAQQAGTTPDVALKLLAEALPHAVDHATPTGMVPQPGTPLPDFGALAAKLLGR